MLFSGIPHLTIFFHRCPYAHMPICPKYALNGSTGLNSVEEWVEASSSWKPAANLTEKRSSESAVVATKALLC